MRRFTLDAVLRCRALPLLRRAVADSGREPGFGATVRLEVAVVPMVGDVLSRLREPRGRGCPPRLGLFSQTLRETSRRGEIGFQR